MSLELSTIKNIVEAALMAAGQPLSLDKLHSLFVEQEDIEKAQIKDALQQLEQELESRGVELVEVGSGYRIQARQDYANWLVKLWEEKPPRYSRALLETMVLIAYRQPITRGEIEDVRGVSVSSHIIKTLQERDWVRVVGHRDVPGRPALYATTKGFLDYFNLKSLDELPTLSEIRDLDSINAQLGLAEGDIAQTEGETGQDLVAQGESAEATAESTASETDVAAVETGEGLLSDQSTPETADDEVQAESALANNDALDAVDAALLATQGVLEKVENAVFRKHEAVEEEPADPDDETTVAQDSADFGDTVKSLEAEADDMAEPEPSEDDSEQMSDNPGDMTANVEPDAIATNESESLEQDQVDTQPDQDDDERFSQRRFESVEQ